MTQPTAEKNEIIFSVQFASIMLSFRNAKNTAERLRATVDYDPDTGVFRWKAQRGGVRAGAMAGYISKSRREGIGRPFIGIDGEQYRASHLAWLYMTGEWPPSEVDHKNCDCGDDSWQNLRLATHAQNNWNKKVNSNSQSGQKGVRKDRTGRSWLATIRINGKRLALGSFATKEDAATAYKKAAQKFRGEFARF